MSLSLIQIITLIVFIGSLSVSFIYDVWKNKKLRLGIVETTVIPILVGLIILYFDVNFLFTDNDIVSILGLLILISGLIFGFFSVKFLGKNKDDFWISKKKEKKRILITNGPYSKIRHPIYTSMILYYFGLILVFFHLVTILFYIVLLIVIIYTAISEEKFLNGKFPKYSAYMKKTGRFFPKFSAK